MSLHVHWFFLHIGSTISFGILTSMKTTCTIKTTRKHKTYKTTSKPRANYKHIGNHRNTLETINTKHNIQYGNDTHIYKYITYLYITTFELITVNRFMFGTAYHPGPRGPQTGPSPFVMHVPTTLLEYDLALWISGWFERLGKVWKEVGYTPWN